MRRTLLCLHEAVTGEPRRWHKSLLLFIYVDTLLMLKLQREMVESNRYYDKARRMRIKAIQAQSLQADLQAVIVLPDLLQLPFSLRALVSLGPQRSAGVSQVALSLHQLPFKLLCFPHSLQ